MKKIISKYGHYCVKMVVDQLAIAMFGLVLSIVSKKAESNTLCWITGIGSVLFYLFLLSTVAVEMGNKDKLAVDAGRQKSQPWMGFLVSLIANSVNVLLAILFLMGKICINTFLAPVGGVCAVIALLVEGMYTGILSFEIGGAPLNTYVLSYFAIILPSVLCVGFTYLLTLFGKISGKLLQGNPYPMSDRPIKTNHHNDFKN